MHNLHAGAVDLNLLLALDALLMERNVTKAAARVGLTQSAMSHKLRRLREVFDDDLLVGGRRGMVPTERAEALAGPVRRGLLELHAAIRSTEPFDPSTAERRFTIISSDYADFVILTRVLHYLEQHAPGVSLRMMPYTNAMQTLLEDGTADLVMGIAIDGAGLKQRAVIDENYAVVLREEHPLLDHDDSITLDQYLGLGHILVSGNDEPGAVDRMLASHGLERRIMLRTPYFVGVPFMVARSDLVATLPRALAQEAATFASIRLLPPPIELASFRITMTWHERSHRDPAHAWLRDLARNLTVEALVDHKAQASTSSPPP
ncbi:MAG: LysR family transcriptional regulator [Myxococcota bacterium]